MILRTLFLSLISILFTFSSHAREKPNVILILADDVGFECFSAYGSREYSTPRLDALASSGTRFNNCHSTPLCTPSRVNLLSGKSNVFNYFDFGIYPTGEPTFGTHFRDHGYATAVAGKWQLLNEAGGITPQEAGFNTYCLWNFPGGGRNRYWDPSLVSDGKVLELPENSYGPDVVTDFLISFIRNNHETPFLAYYPMILPHNPFVTTPNSSNPESKDQKQNFIDMVQHIDKNVGRIEDTLIELGIREETLILFTGDNGTNASLTSKLHGQNIQGGKGFTRDHGTHVPLIVNWPNQVQAGQVVDDLICFSDLFPTLVEAAGLAPKQIAQGDGWSFWPQCTGKVGRKRDWIYCYYFPRPSSTKYDNKYNHFEVRFARNKRYKLYDSGKMYDTIKDVAEENPLPVGESESPIGIARSNLQRVIDSYPESGIKVNRIKPLGPAKGSSQ